MKTRLVLGLGLLVLFLALGIGLMVWTDHTTEPVARDLERAALLVAQGTPEQGKVLALEAGRKWDSRWKFMASFFDHSAMDRVDETFARIRWYAETGDYARVGASCAGLSRMVRGASDDHRFTWWDLL